MSKRATAVAVAERTCRRRMEAGAEEGDTQAASPVVGIPEAGIPAGAFPAVGIPAAARRAGDILAAARRAGDILEVVSREAVCREAGIRAAVRATSDIQAECRSSAAPTRPPSAEGSAVEGSAAASSVLPGIRAVEAVILAFIREAAALVRGHIPAVVPDRVRTPAAGQDIIPAAAQGITLGKALVQAAARTPAAATDGTIGTTTIGIMATGTTATGTAIGRRAAKAIIRPDGATVVMAAMVEAMVGMAATVAVAGASAGSA